MIWPLPFLHVLVSQLATGVALNARDKDKEQKCLDKVSYWVEQHNLGI
jgi:hypothetical protein